MTENRQGNYAFACPVLSGAYMCPNDEGGIEFMVVEQETNCPRVEEGPIPSQPPTDDDDSDQVFPEQPASTI